MPIFGSPNIEKLLAKRDVKGLIDALDYKDASVRKAAITALAEIGDVRMVESLLGVWFGVLC